MRHWSKHEDLILRRLYPDHPRKELAAKLRRSDDSIKSRAEKLGIRKRFGHKPWTATEHARLRELYPDLPTIQVAALLGRTRESIEGQMRIFGLRKTVNYRAALHKAE